VMSLVVAASAPFRAITYSGARISLARVFCLCRFDKVGGSTKPIGSDIAISGGGASVEVCTPNRPRLSLYP